MSLSCVQQTSIEAFTELMLSNTLSDRQKMVYAVLDNEGALNNRLIAEKLRWPINTVTPRVKELRDAGLVVEAFRQRDYATGRTSIYWRTA